MAEVSAEAEKAEVEWVVTGLGQGLVGNASAQTVELQFLISRDPPVIR
ncbi:MAG: hypothetical protein SVY10_08385 [Thermodesulfobacteriota bacterium]|nr:hypothetical protein [Thermodesulfobacteriota bacterium]